MRHHNKNKKFGRDKDQRKALFVALSNAIVERGKIITTETKAKQLRPIIEKLVTRARKNDLASQRIVVARLGSKDNAKRLISEIAPRYEKREGGYTRIVKLTPRASDASKMAVIEFV